MMTDADRLALAQVHFHAVFREIRRMVKYEKVPLFAPPIPGEDVECLWSVLKKGVEDAARQLSLPL